MNTPEETSRIVEFIRNQVNEAHAKGAVVGLSGGVDSALVATLCVKALGPKRVFGVLMPMGFTPPLDAEDADQLADQLGIDTTTVFMEPIVNAFDKGVGFVATDRIAKANVIARARMTTLYFYANAMNFLVAGTGDKSEDLLGFFTKYGDGGVDFLPIAHLYKTEVRELAKELGVPASIYTKPSSPQLWPGHLASHELPADYPILDPALRMVFDENVATLSEVSKATGVGLPMLEEVMRRYDQSRHKRAYPPSLNGAW